MSRANFLEKVKDVLSSEFSEIKFLKTSQNDKADTILPLLIITTISTEFDKSGTRQYKEKLKMIFTIILAETSDPLSALATKEEIVIQKLLTDSLLKQYVSELKPLKTTASNEVTMYQKQGAISSELEIEALFAVSY